MKGLKRLTAILTAAVMIMTALPVYAAENVPGAASDIESDITESLPATGIPRHIAVTHTKKRMQRPACTG